MLSAFAIPSISSPPVTNTTSTPSVVITPGSTEDIDSILLTELCSVKYFICVFNDLEDKYRSFELYGSKMSSSAVEDTLTAELGSALDFAVEFLVVGSNSVLQITNNEAFSLTVTGVTIR